MIYGPNFAVPSCSSSAMPSPIRNYCKFASPPRAKWERSPRRGQALAEWKLGSDETERLLKRGAKLSSGLDDTGLDQLKPLLVKIETLEAEQGRVQARLDQGEVHPPTNGLIVKIHHFAGEYCKVDNRW